MSTNYSREHGNKPNPYNDIPIAISGDKFEGAEIPELICPDCWYIKKQTHGVDYEYTCDHCHHIFSPVQEELRTKSKLSVRGSHDKESRVAYPPDPDANFFKDKNPEPKGGFAELKRRGIKVTSYKEGFG